ncbi:MAG TPA: class I SAM-dependent methyltransferase [Flavisolibacter sp.]|nr:class I SAM-dependent methyltransferase [Flavisolibacter sp.]
MSVSNHDTNKPLFREPAGSRRFVDLYLAVRNSEKRLYGDEEVLWLPDVGKDNRYRKEWRIRKRSAQRFCDYLKQKRRPLRILEVGCGNGWLSHRLAGIKGAQVLGIDINLPELEQAARVFALQENLQFACRDLGAQAMLKEKFDIVVFAASLQYFSSVSSILGTALQVLDKNGEVHIIDTHFYTPAEAIQAGKRSEAYFRSIGVEEMKQFYFQHSFTQIHPFRYEVLYDPHSFIHKIINRHPFHWIRIRGQQ